MILRIILICAIALPSLANAEIYKWKDSDGKMRYSDVPPPSNIKQEPLYGKKIPKPTGRAPLTAVDGDINANIKDINATAAKDKAAMDNAATSKNKAEKEPVSKEQAAAKRAADAEQQKKADEAKQAELKIKQENCKASKSNLATYTNGGRIAKTNENGEREYLSDADINQGKADAQKDVDKYCE
ncbi:hypothetical protein GALL_178360 [mine drainage metagenome]|uniref:DUF4124 domain-containing protein n=1 Tax=mine drainage metagenome TaxID=410659 RepID=A0A1J5RVL8_9ZZZZ